MGTPEIMDQLAIKARSVTGVAGASGAGVTSGVPGLTLDLPGTPWAIVYLDGTVGEMGELTELTERYSVRLYIRAREGEPGYPVLLRFSDLLRAALRTDRDLGGTCDEATWDGAGKVEREDWGDVPHYAISVRVSVLRTETANLTP